MTDILEQGRQRAEAHNGADGDGFKNEGVKNAYVCEKGCGSHIVTIDRAPGVTPFIVRCGNCGGEAYSKMYRVQEWLEPEFEWYRPETLAGIPEHSRDHLANGGLILRPIPGWNGRWIAPRSRFA